jgi:hypothetical protein
LRQTLARTFFQSHIKAYSRSRRKAPIYWQLATPSADYSVWIYIGTFNKDTILRVQNDYVGPKLSIERRNLEALRADAGKIQNAAQRNEIGKKETLVDGLQRMLDEVKLVAPLWNPCLDDGVAINSALLWRLVPHHRSWQRELKATWDSLCKGEYDWTQMAMRLWPERVVLKCTSDRSFAIAHGLERAFWFEDDDGKWKAYDTPKVSVDSLIRERTSPSVKAALKSLLEAPDASLGGKRSRKSRAA